MQNLADYVKVYDDVFDAEFCNTFIQMYEEAVKNDSPYYRRSDHRWEQDYRGFGELAITQQPEFKPYLNGYYNRLGQVYSHYKSTINNDFFPMNHTFEDCRMKKYEPDGHDQFGWHVDVGDKASSSRFIVMLLYLNDVEGGLTRFQSEVDFTVKPKQGRMLLFPPMFLYPHIGEKVIGGPKYIISSYVHYV